MSRRKNTSTCERCVLNCGSPKPGLVHCQLVGHVIRQGTIQSGGWEACALRIWSERLRALEESLRLVREAQGARAVHFKAAIAA